MLYIITDGTSYSQNPASRLKELQTANAKPLVLLGTTEGEIEDEKRYHKLLSDTRLVGEWFSPSPELFELIGKWITNKVIEPQFNLPVLNKIRIHKTAAGNSWFNLTDIAKFPTSIQKQR